MKEFNNTIVVTLVAISWLAGIVLAQGIWKTLFAIGVPPYAWYLVIEKGMLMIGWAK